VTSLSSGRGRISEAVSSGYCEPSILATLRELTSQVKLLNRRMQGNWEKTLIDSTRDEIAWRCHANCIEYARETARMSRFDGVIDVRTLRRRGMGLGHCARTLRGSGGTRTRCANDTSPTRPPRLIVRLIWSPHALPLYTENGVSLVRSGSWHRCRSPHGSQRACSPPAFRRPRHRLAGHGPERGLGPMRTSSGHNEANSRKPGAGGVRWIGLRSFGPARALARLVDLRVGSERVRCR